VKSDDVVGRVKTYEAIIKGQNIPDAGVPESFKVLLKELQSLGLDVSVLNNGEEVEIKESSEYGNTDFRSVMDDDKPYKRESNRELAAGGFSTQVVNDQTQDFEEEEMSDDDGYEGDDYEEDSYDDGSEEDF
jgi:DNA-directed RNA polymerase subunit beta